MIDQLIESSLNAQQQQQQNDLKVKEEPMYYFGIGMDTEPILDDLGPGSDSYPMPEEVLDEDDTTQQEGKVHKCNKCEESFSSQVDLGYHLNSTHPKVNSKHQCPTCVKAFANSTKLRIHIETVHEKKKVIAPLQLVIFYIFKKK